MLSPVGKVYADRRAFWFPGEIEQVRPDVGDKTEVSQRENLEQHIKMNEVEGRGRQWPQSGGQESR